MIDSNCNVEQLSLGLMPRAIMYDVTDTVYYERTRLFNTKLILYECLYYASDSLLVQFCCCNKCMFGLRVYEMQESSSDQQQTSSSTLSPKRLHVSNIPFRFREADLRALLGVSY